ncbi:hypothetical protein GOP47_0019160 [Adiantum capillus-veneris]|uniref:Wax synthase domain-containing protein n=1 Tax=Adiantum capillus-veneris TaxID=13818 RepID=A0A9D4ZBD5_ADICA|nr:hypothetical protein GOP47_0019160 [Adiantum capillus-veneris]
MEELHYMHGLVLFVAAVAGLAVAHRVVLRLPIGLPRLAFILPILPIFFMLPWTIPIYHLRAILSFIFLWTVPSKLLLLCWDAGIDYPSSGFLYFATIVMMPIRVRGRKADKRTQDSHKSQFWWQFIAVIVILNIYSYRNGLPLWAIYVLYTCHMYLGLELMLGGLAKLATACFGVESDPQFNNPFMSASLSEFWGRRWNLVVTTILRSTVYNPALLLLMRAEKQKAHQSNIQKNSSAPETAPPLQTPNSHKQTSTDAALKDEKSETSMTHMQIDMMESSAVNDADPIASETITQMHETPVVASEPTVGNDAKENYNPNQSIHSNSDSEAHFVEPVEGTQQADLRIADAATDITNNTSNLSPESSPCDELNPSFPTIPPDDQFPEHKPVLAKHNLLFSCPNTNPGFNPESEDGAWKPTLRARTVAMLTRAAKQKNLHGFMRFDTTNALNHAEIRENRKAMSENGEKPSLRARAVAMLVTFAVSGLVHELIFYYINKSRATGEVTAFFILHGCATAMEVLLKKTMLAHLQLPRPLSIALTLAFLYATAAWLFMPPLTRYGADINTIAEYQRLQSALLSLLSIGSHFSKAPI